MLLIGLQIAHAVQLVSLSFQDTNVPECKPINVTDNVK